MRIYVFIYLFIIIIIIIIIINQTIIIKLIMHFILAATRIFWLIWFSQNLLF